MSFRTTQLNSGYIRHTSEMLSPKGRSHFVDKNALFLKTGDKELSIIRKRPRIGMALFSVDLKKHRKMQG